MHFEAIMRTPLGSSFKALYEQKVNIKHADRISKPIRRIMKSYSPKQDIFVIAGEVLHLIVNDVALTFGLPKVRKEVVLFPRTLMKAMDSTFLERRFMDVKFSKKDAIVFALNKTLKEEANESAEDFARLIILYMVVTILFVSSQGSIGWSFVTHLEGFNNISKIAWATVVRNHLMQNVRKFYDEPLKTPRCVIHLIYWFCEHYRIIQPIERYKDETLRFIRWDVSDARQAMFNLLLDKLDPEKVVKLLDNISESEQKLLIVEVNEELEERENHVGGIIETLQKENKRLTKENMKLLGKVIGLETLMQVKSNGVLKHTINKELQLQSIDSSMVGSLCMKNDNTNYIDFECLTTKENRVMMKTPPKIENEQINE